MNQSSDIKLFGTLLLLVGIIILCYFVFYYDTTISSSPGSLVRYYNIGLQQNRQLGCIGGMIAAAVGLVLIGFGLFQQDKEPSPEEQVKILAKNKLIEEQKIKEIEEIRAEREFQEKEDRLRAEEYKRNKEWKLQQLKIKREKRVKWFNKFWNEHILNSNTVVIDEKKK